MAHPAVENKTGFAHSVLNLSDEAARPVVVVVLKGTFLIGPTATCAVAPEQVPVNLAGQPWGKDAATSSYRYEPEVAFTKPATDVVLIGHAYAPRSGSTETRVGLRVGDLQHGALVTGDRVWFKALGGISASRPVAFEKIPLRWERAFGGWDRSHADPARHVAHIRNPVGVGFRPSRTFDEGLRLPNIEDPQRRLQRLGDDVPSVGFGFVSPQWQPRAAFAGTFDPRWQKERAPLLPKNFDRRYLNAAPPELTARGYLRGDEPVVVAGVSARGTLRFALPGVPPPAVRFVLRGGDQQLIRTNLDTVIIEPDEMRVMLLWRAHVTVRSGPLDVRSLELLAGTA